MNLEEMWARLAQHQPFADRRGYGPAWAAMCEERTQDSAWEAQREQFIKIFCEEELWSTQP